MHITNETDNCVAFKVNLPSGKVFRVEIDGGETIGVSPAIRYGLPDNDHFNSLVAREMLSVSHDAENSS